MNSRYVFASLIGLSLFFGASYEALAQHKGISFQAVLKKSDGSYPTASGVTVTAQILDPANHCVLREEEHSGKNISKGYLNLVLGDSNAATPGPRNPSPVLSLSQVLDNKTARTNLKCVDQVNNIVGTGQSYVPTNLDRRVLRIRLNLQGEDIVADFNMRAVGFAVNSEMLNSKSDEDFVNINNGKGITQTNVESIFERFTKLDAILNSFNSGGTSAGINISGNASTATTATSVSGTVAIANGGTGATTGAGARTNLGLGSLATMSPTGTADNTTYLRGDGTWASVSGGGFSGSLAGDVSGPQGTTVVDKIKGQTVTATANIAGQVLRYAGGNNWTPGFVAMTDLRSTVTGANSFASSCANNQTLVYNSVGDVMSCQNISLPSSQITGLGDLAAKGSVDLGTSDATGTLASARMPALTGDVTLSAGTTATTIANNAVTTTKINNLAVTDAKINDVAFSKVTGTPTTLAGYGITDASPAAGSTNITTLGTVTTGTWNGSTIAVARGGTGTSTGSITGTTALTFTAGGSNTNVNLVPQGTGTVDVANKKITSLATPTAAADAATKAYVDAASGGSCPVIGGNVYFTEGGNPAFCKRLSLTVDGAHENANANEGRPCDTGKICVSGQCIVSGVDCVSGAPSIGNTCSTGTIYAGTHNGYKYMTTPAGCDNSVNCSSGTRTTDNLQLAWANSTGTTAYNVVTGASNTTYGFTQTQTLATSYTDTDAAKFCRKLVYGGYTDWYLPARDELSLLFTNRSLIGGFISGSYWASTEANSYNGSIIPFNTGTPTSGNKAAPNFVRCVRRY